MNYSEYELSDEHMRGLRNHPNPLLDGFHKEHFDAWLKERDKRLASAVAELLRRWEVADGNIGRFDRGLHILAHLARGGTLEEYGEPDA